MPREEIRYNPNPGERTVGLRRQRFVAENTTPYKDWQIREFLKETKGWGNKKIDKELKRRGKYDQFANQMQEAGVTPARYSREGQQKYDRKLSKVTAEVERTGQLNELPAKVVDGMPQYDLEAIGERLGLTPEQVQAAANVQFPDRFREQRPDERFERPRGLRGYRNDAFTMAKLQLKDGPEAIINNLAQLDPLTDVRLDNEDVITNLAKPGFMAGIDYASQEDRINEGQGPSWGAQTFGTYGPAAFGALASALTGGLGSGIAAPLLAQIGTGAAAGALTSKAQGQNALKGALMGAGSVGVGAGASQIGAKAAQLAGGTGRLANFAGRGASALTTGLGNEILDAAILGDKFSPQDVLTGAAKAAAIDVGTELVKDQLGSLFNADSQVAGATDAPGTVGSEGDTLAVQDRAPTALEVEFGPSGDIGLAGEGTPVTFSEQGMQNLPGNLQTGYSHIQSGLAQVDPTGQGVEDTGGDFIGERFEQGGPIISDEADLVLQSPTGADSLLVKGLPDIPTPTQVTGGAIPIDPNFRIGPTTPGMTETSLDPLVFGKPLGAPEDYTNVFGTRPDIAAMRADPYAPPVFPGQTRGSEDPTVQGEPIDAPDTYTNIFGDVPGTVFGPPSFEMYTGGQTKSNVPKFGGGNFRTLPPESGDVNAPPPSTPDLGGRQAGMFGSTAGQYDPISEQQIMKTGMVSQNPKLLSQFMEFDALSPEEKKRRKGLWMANPVIEGA